MYKREKYNCVRYIISSKVLFNFFKNLNFPIGKKNKLSIHKSIIKNNRNALACVRGIFNTDGTIYRRYSKQYSNHSKLYNYAIIQIKLKSKKVITQIKGILNKNRIKTTKIGNIDNKYFVIRITDQNEIKKFIDIIKPSNEYHLKRYINILNS